MYIYCISQNAASAYLTSYTILLFYSIFIALFLCPRRVENIHTHNRLSVHMVYSPGKKWLLSLNLFFSLHGYQGNFKNTRFQRQNLVRFFRF